MKIRNGTVMRREFFNGSVYPDGLYMMNCRMEKCEEPFSFSPDDSGGYRMFNVTEGEGTVEADGRQYPAAKGDLFIFRPGVGIKLSSGEAERLWSFCMLTFGGTDAEFYLSEAGCAGQTVKKTSVSDRFHNAVKKCLDMCESEKTPPSQAQINTYLLDALSSLKPVKSGRVRLRASEQAERAERFIEFNYKYGITARDVAAELNIDRTHFFRIFKAKTGLSPEQYIMKLRIRKAKELLAAGANTVTEIASLVGVGDVYYFSKLFKRAEGVSPTEYRKSAADGRDVKTKDPEDI